MYAYASLSQFTVHSIKEPSSCGNHHLVIPDNIDPAYLILQSHKRQARASYQKSDHRPVKTCTEAVNNSKKKGRKRNEVLLKLLHDISV